MTTMRCQAKMMMTTHTTMVATPEAKDVDLYLHKQGLDTSTPAGKAMFQMLGVFAEFEREIIAERIHAGLARAKEHGTKSGKPIGRPEVFGTVQEKAMALKKK